MQATLGEDCAMDPSAFCWIARSGSPATPARNGAAAPPAPAGAPAGGGGGAVANDDAAGMNFGMPHRDFTCLQSLDKDGACGPAPPLPAPPRPRAPTLPRATPPLTGPSPNPAPNHHPHRWLRLSSGAPTLLSVWLPLTEVTTDNGCMMVVPRTLDRHFTNRWAYAHMRPALHGEDDETLELRFDLQAARALAPLARGSVVAGQHGQTLP